MKLIYQKSLLNRLASLQKVAAGSRVRAAATIGSAMTTQDVSLRHRMHTSLNEAVYFPPELSEDDYDAHHFGYRVAPVMHGPPHVPPRRHYSSHMKIKTSYDKREDFEEYDPVHNVAVDSFDILSSPEVVEILASQKDWDTCLEDESLTAAGSTPFGNRSARSDFWDYDEESPDLEHEAATFESVEDESALD